MIIKEDWIPTVGNGTVTATLAVGESSIGLKLSRHDRPLGVVALGISVDGADLGSGSTVVRSSEFPVIEEWFAPAGKARGNHLVDHRELRVDLHHAATDREWTIRLRVSPDGIAVRYAMPELQGLAGVTADNTSIDLELFSRAWVLKHQTWYETPRAGVDLAELEPGSYGFPFLAQSGDDYLLVSESGIDGRYSGAHAAMSGTTLGFEIADAAVEIARGDVTPWRVFIIGSLADVVESLFVDELASPVRPELADADWIRPGRAAWSWWSDFYSGAQLEQQKRFVDAAAEMSWEHLLIDCGWEETWVPEIVAYASRRGIQVHLWTVWHDLDGPDKLGRLALWRSWGVAGIKVDFMESESKDRYRWYDSVLQETARLGLMVNFHGSVIPRGWARTWPQVVGYEAVRGSEYYVFYNDTPLTAEHNVILPFTRNVVGAMDYTPVAFSAADRVTSDGHELGLSVVFECGITHFADDVAAYAERPLAARFLAELAPVWDETVLLSGTPDTEAVIARRHGDRWFIGCIATGRRRTLTINLDRLGLINPTTLLIEDTTGLADSTGSADDAAGLVERTVSGSSFEVSLADNGGFVAIVSDGELFRSAPRAVVDAPTVEPELAVFDDDNVAVVRTSADARVRVAPGWSAEVVGDGRWRIQAPSDLPPGSQGIVTVESTSMPPAITHARVVAPLVAGVHRVSALPMLAFQNESGPVERDLSNGGGNPADGSPMRIAGAHFADGLGVSTPSKVDLYFGGHAGRFTVSVGIDDETPLTSARAVVSGDGRELSSVVLEAGNTAVDLDVDVSGVRVVTLSTREVAAGDPPAHVDWASARFIVTKGNR
ncbi:glycoside hydrolase family 97 catalytic domain-containing protein [Kribbella ginsengisoli]|uniref:Glycosyl hydrolase family 98 putative carbohydrate-binding module domain-containing protein n=1 Tax=Kribbella ginsengisoli TaxID=363865 RepID=A0ABP6YMR5_9ACTN